MTDEQGCESRDEFTNGSPRDLWVRVKETGGGKGATVNPTGRKGSKEGWKVGYLGPVGVNYPH